VGEQNVREAIQIILLTETRERLRLPEFGGGLRRFLFEPNNPSTHHLLEDAIQTALSRWEPRINLELVEVNADPNDDRAALAVIEYRLVATGLRERMSLSVSLTSV
jgi:phage baseplate assembly protein W